MTKARSRTVFAVTLATAGLLAAETVSANERIVSRSLKALNVLCIETQFDQSSLDETVQLFQHRKLSKHSFKKLSLANEAGYAVIVDRSPVTVTFGKRISDAEVSRNCTVTIKDLDFSDATALLKSHYSAEELDRFSHGRSQIAVYGAAFPGYAADMYLSVQTGSGLTALSFFETPIAKTR